MFCGVEGSWVDVVSQTKVTTLLFSVLFCEKILSRSFMSVILRQYVEDNPNYENIFCAALHSLAICQTDNEM
jgi:hypothetical protein